MVVELEEMMHSDICNNSDVVIIPDLHDWHKNIKSIQSMTEDLAKYKKDILDYVSTLQNPIVIFAGDVFHREVKVTDDAYNLQQFYTKLSNLCRRRVFSVVGNHELSYQRNNIFWNIVSSVSDIYPGVYSESPLMIVCDELLIGKTLIHLGHYQRSGYVTQVSGKNVSDDILITHNSLLTPEISEALKLDSEEFDDTYLHGAKLFDEGAIPYTDRLRAVFVGHMHLAHAVYHISETINDIDYSFILHYMGSIGRTNAKEFTQDLKRELPTLHIRNGELENISNHTINLVAREFAINEIVVKQNKENYKRQARNNEIRYASISFPNGLMPALEEYLKTSPHLNSAYTHGMAGSMPVEVASILSKYSI